MLLLAGVKDYFKDLINPQTLVIKCVYFFTLTAIAIIYPQLTIHQKALGITEYQTGIISQISSFVTMFFPFVAGCIGDKVGNYRILMSIICIITGGMGVLFAFVPSALVEVTSYNITNATLSNSSLEVSSPASNTTLKETDPDQLEVTFWLYTCIRIAHGMAFGMAYTLFDAAVMANIQNSGINYGYQRAWGTIGALITASLGGVIVDSTGSFKEIFYISAALSIITGLLMLGINIDFKIPAVSLTKEIFQQLFKAEPLLHFGALLAAGMFIGYFETFVYRYLSELGGSETLIGLTVTVGAPVEFVMTLTITYLVKKFGFAPLITLGLLVRGLQFLGFGFLENPWWALPLESVESVADAFFYTTGAVYATVLFPTETIASFRGLQSVTFGGIGKIVGITIGSEIKENYGHQNTFLIWAVVAIICGVLYGSGYYVLEKCGFIYTSTSSLEEREGAKRPIEEKKDANHKKEISGIDNAALENSP